MVTAIREHYPHAYLLKVHGNGYQRIGVPDVMVTISGATCAIEAKHREPGESLEHMHGRVSAQQRREIKALRDAGAVADVAHTVEGALMLARHAAQGTRPQTWAYDVDAHAPRVVG